MKLLQGLGLLALLCGVGIGPSWAASAPVKSVAVAIVDVQRVLQEATAAKSVQQQLDSQRSKFQAQITTEEDELRKAEQELAKIREKGQTEAYADKEQHLRQRFLTVERHVQARRKALDQSFADSMGTVRKSIVEVVSQVAKERNVNLVIVKQQVIWNDDVIDITDEVLTRLNKTLPQLQAKVVPENDRDEDGPLAPMPQKPAKK